MRFEDDIWEKIGADARELLRKASKAHDTVPEEERPKAFAGALWLTWVMGYFDHQYGRKSFFGYTMPPEKVTSTPPDPLPPKGEAGPKRTRRGRPPVGSGSRSRRVTAEKP
jgi:hypothetical protein